MPWVDLQTPDDYASIFYFTTSITGNAGGLDPNRPTVILLHPIFLDSTWVDIQFQDLRLYTSFNLVAFDMRSSGKSKCRLNPLHDSWVNAADLALCMQKLHLPACHVLAFESISVDCALRFAVLFPEMCLSITLCNLPPSTKSEMAYLEELVQGWCLSEDLMSSEDSGSHILELLYGLECGSELGNQIIHHWRKIYPQSQRRRMLMTSFLLIHRQALNSEIIASIKHPVLVIHGERNILCSKKQAQRFTTQFTNAQDGVVFYIVKGASAGLSINYGDASIAHQTFAKFVNRISPTGRTDPVFRNDQVILDRMSDALVQLAKLTRDPDRRGRDPMSPMSFSCLPPDLVKIQSNALELYRTLRQQALAALGSVGQPIRKRCERTPHDMISIAGGNANSIYPYDLKNSPKRGKTKGTTVQIRVESFDTVTIS